MTFVKYILCDYCIKKIYNNFIFCVECEVNICIKCFCYGIESGNHRKTHRYKIESILNQEKLHLFNKTPNWNCDEEIKLLDAVSAYKIGNWWDIASAINSKTHNECRQHFMENYVRGPFGRLLSTDKYRKTSHVVYDHTEGSSAPYLYENQPFVLIKRDEAKALGFMPNRNEFIVESEDNFEKILANIYQSQNSVNTNSDPTDELLSSFRTTIIDIYNYRLLLRNYRKRIAREHNLISHIIPKILDKPVRDFPFFQRQMLKKVQPPPSASSSRFSLLSPGVFRQKSFRGRTYVHKQLQPISINDNCCGESTNSIYEMSTTPSESDNVCSTTGSVASQSVTSPLSFNCFREYEEHPSWHYNALHLPEPMKPFLRYLSAATTKVLVENLKKEETLKMEIITLQGCIRHGIRDYRDYKERLEKMKSAQNPNVKNSNDDKDDKTNKKRKRRRGLLRAFTVTEILRRKRWLKYRMSLQDGHQTV